MTAEERARLEALYRDAFHTVYAGGGYDVARAEAARATLALVEALIGPVRALELGEETNRQMLAAWEGR